MSRLRSNEIYRFASVDLNGDGRPERIQYAYGLGGCGTGGCTLEILTQRNGSWEQIGRIPTVSTPVSVLDTKQGGWRDIAFRSRFDAVLSYHGVMRFADGAYAKHDTGVEYDWETPIEGEVLFAPTEWPEEPDQDIRQLLIDQGFQAPLNGREEILYVGAISQGANTYQIYTYRGIHRPLPESVDHGVNKVLVLLIGSTFFGQYSVAMPTECRAQEESIECATEEPGSTIAFTEDGPPDEIWFDGEVLELERVTS